jgi:outer membrane protein assembly factor BamB
MSGSCFQTHGLPLDRRSPWPKFRANAMQNGRMDLQPEPNEKDPWVFKTGKGIFSSPVVDGSGCVYIGSADHIFYALNPDGSVKWTLPADEIIDSSALLDDRGRLYFASGDSHLYCVDRDSGALIWRFRAQTLPEVEAEFGIKTYNLTWFEGNTGILPGGGILAPNDNYIVYRLNRDTGERERAYPANEMIWSLPAVNPETGRIFFGTCFMLNENLFCYDYETGEKLWSAGAMGSVSASPLLTPVGGVPAVVVGCFDGYIRAYAQEDGALLWQTGLRDHVYASPAQLSTGELIQTCTDGTVYCLDPAIGEIEWTFDTLEPIRSSPAVDGRDQIYFGNGEGKLFCLNADGSLRWWYRCITDPRSDMNASPALGKDGVYIAGESGEIFFVPYDYPLREKNVSDPRCKAGPKGDLPDEGAHLMYTGPFGAKETTAPEAVDRNAPLAFSLMIRKGGRSVAAVLDKDDFSAHTDDGSRFEAHLSADGRFVCVHPKETWRGDEEGRLNLRLAGSYRINLEREGLRFFGGEKGGEIDQRFQFTLNPVAKQSFPFRAPEGVSGASTVLELCRQAVPLPTMMPSLNQIGFDSLHYLAGLVEKRGDRALAWVLSGKLNEKDGTVTFDPGSAVRYPLLLRADDGLFTLYNYDGFKINFVGSWDMPNVKHRIATVLDGEGNFIKDAAYVTLSDCDKIEFYGPGLKMMGLSDYETGLMCAFGGMTIKRWGELSPPEGLGEICIEAAADGVRAVIEGSALLAKDHIYSLLLTDPAGHPLPLYYTRFTQVTAAADGTLREISLSFDEDETVQGEITVRLMVDTYPAYKAVLTI